MGLSVKHGAGDDDESTDIMAEINITPLTDIFLVLLIIFMVTSSVMSNQGMDVKLPKASAASTSSQPEGVVVTLLPGGGMKVGNESIGSGNFEKLESVLKSALSQTREKLVVLEGDQQAFLGQAVSVMDTAKRAGAEKFAVATASADTSGKRDQK